VSRAPAAGSRAELARLLGALPPDQHEPVIAPADAGYLLGGPVLDATSPRTAFVTRIPNRNRYWNRSGLMFLDPDGYRLVIAAAPSASGGLEREGQVIVDEADGDRALADG
jgi:hypothetical protein